MRAGPRQSRAVGSESRRSLSVAGRARGRGGAARGAGCCTCLSSCRWRLVGGERASASGRRGWRGGGGSIARIAHRHHRTPAAWHSVPIEPRSPQCLGFIELVLFSAGGRAGGLGGRGRGCRIRRGSCRSKDDFARFGCKLFLRPFSESRKYDFCSSPVSGPWLAFRSKIWGPGMRFAASFGESGCVFEIVGIGSRENIVGWFRTFLVRYILFARW